MMRRDLMATLGETTSPFKFLQLIAVLWIAWPNGAIADDSSPRANAVTITCQQAQHQMIAGTTRASFRTEAKWTTTQKGKQWCAKLDAGVKVVKNVSSSYKEWHVAANEKNCQAEADRANSAVKGFEQEHIGDATKVLQDANARLNQLRSDFCADSEAEAIRKGNAAVDKVSQDAGTSYQAMADKRDSTGHSHNVNCDCAH
jgi:hypothetical protein